MNRRKTPKQKRGKQKVNMIMRMAAKLFSQQGYESTTTRHIADQANLPIGTIYQFFGNKKEILLALAEFYGSRIDEHFSKLINSPLLTKAEPSKLPSILVDSMFEFDDKNPEFYKIFNFGSCTLEMVEVTELLDKIMISRLGKICKLFKESFQTKENKLQLLTMYKSVLFLFMTLQSDHSDFNKNQVVKEMEDVCRFYLERFVII
jgi:AcrR family transcriptional regulator